MRKIKTLIVTELKNLSCEKKSLTQIVLNYKNSNCDNSKAQITINLKVLPNLKTQIVAKLKNSNCEKKIKKFKLRQNSICIKLKISNRDKTQKLKLLQNSNYDKFQFMREEIKKVF